MSRLVEVVPDVSGLDRRFAYRCPDELDDAVAVGTIVRVVLHNRRVRAWVVALDVAAPAGVELRPLVEVVSLGPSLEVVAACHFAAWRFAGRLRPPLVSASPPRLVRSLPEPAAAGPAVGGSARPELAAATLEALSGGRCVLRLPPAAPRLDVVVTALDEVRRRGGDLLVLAPTAAEATTLGGRLRRLGVRVADYPEQWAAAAAGGAVVVGTRRAALASLPTLGGAVVLDAHAESYREERIPTWDAPTLLAERCATAGVPLVLVSACPPLELVHDTRVVTLPRLVERAGWAPIELLDARDEDPRAGGYPSRLAQALRLAVEADPTRPAVAVLNRTGRARLLACRRCQSLLRCEACGSALAQAGRPASGAPAVLVCPRGDFSGPAVCPTCGPTRTRVVRPGVAGAADSLAALTGLEVAEVSGSARASGGLPPAQLLVGTEAVLHRAASASLVAFLDFDHELLAPRLRASEQALALLALAARLVGGHRRSGRVVVRTRLVDHEVLQVATGRDDEALLRTEAAQRRALRLPPFAALAAITGEGSAALAERLAALGAEVGGGADRVLVRAPDAAALAALLAAAEVPTPDTRVEVDPRDL